MRRVGEAIEALDDAEDHVEALAFHFAQAARERARRARPRATDWLPQRRPCGRSGRRGGDHPRRSRPGGDRATSDRITRSCGAELHLVRGRAQRMLGEMSELKDAALAAAEAARACGLGRRPRTRRIALPGMERPRGPRSHSRPLSEEALALLPVHEELWRTRLRAQLANRLAYVEGKPEIAEPMAEEALDVARRLGDRTRWPGRCTPACRPCSGPSESSKC